MAIGVRTRPEFVVFGSVQRVAERRKKADDSVYAHDVVVDSPGGGLWLRYWNRDAVYQPGVGEIIAVIASADEGDSASLNFVRRMSPDDLDLIQSASGLVAAGGK